MQTNELEKDLQKIGVKPDRPQALLALPLVSVCAADGIIPPDEVERMEAFARMRIGFDEGEMKAMRGWIENPPSARTTDDACYLLSSLREHGDAIGFENETFYVVLSEAESVLRARGDDLPSQRGRVMLTGICEKLAIDLGTPWENVAPEQFDQEAMKHKHREGKDERDMDGKPVRRLLAARRTDRDDSERGGII